MKERQRRASAQIARGLPHRHVERGPPHRSQRVFARRPPSADAQLHDDPASVRRPSRKLPRRPDPTIATHSHGEVLEVGRVSADELRAALDWLVRWQSVTETTLARHHLKTSGPLMFDVTSTSVRLGLETVKLDAPLPALRLFMH